MPMVEARTKTLINAPDRIIPEPGDKTMLDAWLPAAAEGAARRGRSAKLGDRSVGHIDPGAASAFVMLDAMASTLERS